MINIVSPIAGRPPFIGGIANSLRHLSQNKSKYRTSPPTVSSNFAGGMRLAKQIQTVHRKWNLRPYAGPSIRSFRANHLALTRLINIDDARHRPRSPSQCCDIKRAAFEVVNSATSALKYCEILIVHDLLAGGIHRLLGKYNRSARDAGFRYFISLSAVFHAKFSARSCSPLSVPPVLALRYAI